MYFRISAVSESFILQIEGETINMDMYMQQAVEKLQNWFCKASKWQKDLFCTLWEQNLKEEQILDRVINPIEKEYL